MRSESISSTELESILRAALSPLVAEIAGLRAEVADLKSKVQAKETAAQRRERLERQAIFLIAEHAGAWKSIARAIDVPVNTLRRWPKFTAARDKYLGLLNAEAHDRYTDHFEHFEC